MYYYNKNFIMISYIGNKKLVIGNWIIKILNYVWLLRKPYKFCKLIFVFVCCILDFK